MEALNTFSNPGLIISASHLETPGGAIIEGLEEVLGHDATIIGGMAGDDSYQGAVVFDARNHSHRGLVSLILDMDRIELSGQAVSGWKSVGTKKIITKSEGSWVYTIDDVPALDMLVKYNGLQLDDDETSEFGNIIAQFPFQLEQERGKPVMTVPLVYNRKTKAIMCTTPVSQGAKFRFSMPPDFDVIDSVINSAQEVHTTAMKEADAMIIFSCLGRFILLGPLIDQEVNGLNDVWGVPMAGFFSFGEFGRVEGGTPEYHGTTCSWVALHERE